MDGSVGVFAQVLSEPADPFAAHDMVTVDEVFDAFDGGAVASEENLCLGLVLAHQSSHFFGFEEVGDDEADADGVVALAFQLSFEIVAGRKVEHGNGSADVFRQEVQAEGAMMEAKRRDPLGFGHLIVK